MRVFLDDILAFINAESLTDDEFDSIPDTLVESYNEYVYQALRSTLQGRESVSLQLKKLKGLFIAKGVFITESSTPTPVSHILVGSVLE